MNNTTKRLLLGVLSSLLLAAGFARAADRIDPMSNGLHVSTTSSLMDPPPPCSMPCMDE